MFSLLSALFISIYREEEGGGRGGEGERRLWPVPRIQLNKFYVRTALFFGGVIFCGEGKGGVALSNESPSTPFDQNSASDLKRPKNDDCYTLCSENERIARYTRNERPQTRSGSSTSERKCVSVV